MADVIDLPTAAARRVIARRPSMGVPPSGVTDLAAARGGRRVSERNATASGENAVSAERIRGRLESVVANATVGLSEESMQWLFDETVARVAALRVIDQPAGTP